MQNKFKRLAIISDCIHMVDGNGNSVTEVHIFCRQMQALAALFEHTTICCPFVPFDVGKVVTAYTDKSIDFIPLKNVGGNTAKDKLSIITNIPGWLKAFHKARKSADIIYMRFPNNLNVVGFFYFYFYRSKTFATYTGTWRNYKGEPATYRFQKWLLKHFFKGPVWLYITEPRIGRNLFKGISPSYTLKEWQEETDQVNRRVSMLQVQSIQKPVFITVGTLNANKNQQLILNAFKMLHDENFPFFLYVVGDGELKSSYQQYVDQHNLGDCINICGKKTYTQLRELYRKSDFLIQASLVEGFGKVPIEGFFHGVIPLLSRVALAEEMTGSGARGFTFSADKADNLVALIKQVTRQDEQLGELIVNGRAYAQTQTLENWATSYLEKINEIY